MNLQETKLAGIGTIQWEDEDTSFETENSLDQEFAALLAEEVTNEVKEGTIVEGTIVRFTDDSVVVDIGHKSEGQIKIAEFMADGKLNIKEGDEVEVYAVLSPNEDEEIAQ